MTAQKSGMSARHAHQVKRALLMVSIERTVHALLVASVRTSAVSGEAGKHDGAHLAGKRR